MLGANMIAYFSDMHASAVYSSVIVLGFEYCTNFSLIVPRGETDSAIRWRKRTGVTSPRETEEAGWLLRTFLKPSLKMPSIFCEFGCYN